jgi:RNase H-fold protein (predicted Holliday junction resolvase)
MEINMEYNTSRQKLVLPEYGRNIQKMVEMTIAETDPEKKNRMAQAIIAIMGNMNPHLRDIADFKHKLWDHLAIIADFKLDIDTPYEKPLIEKLKEKPEVVPYNRHKIKYKHYGKTIEKLINEAIKMEDPEKKEVLIQMLANHMKKSYLTWNKEAVSDEQIFSDLNEISEGKISLTIQETRLAETKDILAKNKHRRTPIPRKKQ